MFAALKKFFPRSFKRPGKRVLQSLCDSVAYRFGRRQAGIGKIRRLVFVCKGNICRSAFAEHYLRSLGAGANVRIESCGLDVDQGGGPPPEAVQIAGELGLDMSAHRSKGIIECDLQGADLVVAMEYGQYLRLRKQFPSPKGKVRLLRDFAPWPESLACNLYDPFGLGEKEFRRCFIRMERALIGLNRHLEAPVIDAGGKDAGEMRAEDVGRNRVKSVK